MFNPVEHDGYETLHSFQDLLTRQIFLLQRGPMRPWTNASVLWRMGALNFYISPIL